jgi:hypothetical protein
MQIFRLFLAAAFFGSFFFAVEKKEQPLRLEQKVNGF